MRAPDGKNYPKYLSVIRSLRNELRRDVFQAIADRPGEQYVVIAGSQIPQMLTAFQLREQLNLREFNRGIIVF